MEIVTCGECRYHTAVNLSGRPFCHKFQMFIDRISGCAAGEKKPVFRGDLVRQMSDEELAAFMTMVAVRGGEACANVLGLGFETSEEDRQSLTGAHLRWLREEIFETGKENT